MKEQDRVVFAAVLLDAPSISAAGADWDRAALLLVPGTAPAKRTAAGRLGCQGNGAGCWQGWTGALRGLLRSSTHWVTAHAAVPLLLLQGDQAGSWLSH